MELNGRIVSGQWAESVGLRRSEADGSGEGRKLLLFSQLCLTLCDSRTVACQASLSFIISQYLLKLMSIESVMPSNHFIICCPLLLLPSIFPSFRVFANESALHIRWPKYWSFSFSINPSNMNIQGWFPLGLPGWSPYFSMDSKESSAAPQLEGINSLALSLFYCPALRTVHDYQKNHSFDYTGLHWQRNVFAF